MSAPASSKHGSPANFDALCERWGPPPAELTTAAVDYIVRGFLCEARLHKRKHRSSRARRACSMAAKVLRGIRDFLPVESGHTAPQALSGGGEAHPTAKNGGSMDIEQELQPAQPIGEVEGSGAGDLEALGACSIIKIGVSDNNAVVSAGRGPAALVLPERPAQTSSGLTLEELEHRSRWMVEVLVPKLEIISRELEGYNIHHESSD